MLRVISLSFIVLPELVKHILVAGVVRRNIKFSVKIYNIVILKLQMNRQDSDKAGDEIKSRISEY